MSTQNLSAAQQAQVNNRNETGQWKQKTHGDVDDTAGVLGVSYDVGDAAYDQLSLDEQEAWQAWREMTGKSEETVAGQAKADDIAEFKQHYLSTLGDSGLPNMEMARKLGLSDDEQTALSQWDEMVSSGTIEQHQDSEIGEFHSFAHPDLVAQVHGQQDSAPTDERELHQRLFNNDPTLTVSGASAALFDDDEDPEDGWEDIEPDFDDHSFASSDAMTQSGLSNLQYGEAYWDDQQAYSSALPEGRTGALGFDARGSFDEVESDYLPEDLAERVQRHGDRNLSIANYAANSRTQCGESNQFVSVELNEAERNAVVDYLDGEDDEGFNDELVHYWSAGEPAQMDRTFGFVSPKQQWYRVSDAVRDRAPNAAHALETAEDLRREANKSFEAEVAHMHTDDWKKEQAALRNER